MSSFCANCGGALASGANFCSACGRPVTNPLHPVNYADVPLVRPRVGRKVAGICQGLANRYGWDVSLTRVFTVLLAILTFPIGLLAYGLLWLVVPEQAAVLPTASSLRTTP